LSIIITGSGGDQTLEPAMYNKEEELHDFIARFPNLLTIPGEPGNILVRKKIGLPRAGELDLLLVDRDGLPIVVEVKLAKNRQARREVVGQIIDYVSDITSLTVDELDDAVDGALSEALMSLSGDSQTVEYERIWKAVGTNLRAGLVRYIIVVDEVPDDLERIVRFLVLHSNLDIRLIRIQRYHDMSGQHILVPSNVIDVMAMDRPAEVGKAGPSPELLAVLESYSKICDPAYPAGGKAPRYRQIKVPGWPRGIHYEFMKTGDSIMVDLHIEMKDSSTITPAVKELVAELRDTLPQGTVWDSSWSKGRGRISCPLPSDLPPDDIASAMCQLINSTLKRISGVISTQKKEKD